MTDSLRMLVKAADATLENSLGGKYPRVFFHLTWVWGRARVRSVLLFCTPLLLCKPVLSKLWANKNKIKKNRKISSLRPPKFKLWCTGMTEIRTPVLRASAEETFAVTKTRFTRLAPFTLALPWWCRRGSVDSVSSGIRRSRWCMTNTAGAHRPGGVGVSPCSFSQSCFQSANIPLTAKDPEKNNGEKQFSVCFKKHVVKYSPK